MKLLYFNSSHKENSHSDVRFLGSFPFLLPCWEIISFSSVAKLADALKKPSISFESIVLLYIHNEEEINTVLEQQSLFIDVDTIIILLNTSRSLSDNCYRISPRMVFKGEPDPMTLISVLMKKAQHLLQRHPAMLRNCS